MQLYVVYLYLVSEEGEDPVKIFYPHFYLSPTTFGNRPNFPGESTALHNNHFRPRFYYPHAYSLENAWYWDTTCLVPKILDLSAVYHYYSDFVKLTLMRLGFS